MATIRPRGIPPWRALAIGLGLVAVLAGGLPGADGKYPEPTFQGWNQLGNFEERQLRKAEEAYAAALARGHGKRGEKLWLNAASKYNLFIEEYPEAAPDVTAYAVYRQGRCYHHYHRRNQARNHYDDVIEFFPNQVPFATAALFFKGRSYQEDSNDDRAMQEFAKIAKDPQYRRQALAGYAIVDLAKYTWGKGKRSRAVEYFKDVVREFRHKNREAAKVAIDYVLQFYVRSKPDEGALREFFIAAKGFGDRPLNTKDAIVPEDVATGKYRDKYWTPIRRQVESQLRWGFKEIQEDDRKRFASRWAEIMEGMNPDWDDYQIDRLRYRYVGDGNRQRFEKDLDAQFKAGYKSGDWGRILKWMGYYQGCQFYGGNPDKFVEYFKLLKLDRMGFGHLRKTLERITRARKSRGTMFGIVKSKLKLDSYRDGELAWIAEFFYRYDDKEYAIGAAKKMKNDAEGNWTIFRLIVRDETRQIAEVEGYAQKLFKVEKYAGDAHWALGERYQNEKRYQDAIREYHAAGRGAESGFAAAECQMKAGNLKAAILELQGVEGMFKKAAPAAAYKQAQYYDAKGKAESRNQTLRRILLRYKGTKEASDAHVWYTDRLGMDYVGGEAADD